MIALRSLALYGVLSALVVDAMTSQGHHGVATNSHVAKQTAPHDPNHPIYGPNPNHGPKLMCRCMSHSKERDETRFDYGMQSSCGYHLTQWPEAKRPWCRAKYHCGTSTPLGSWFYCDEAAIERRRDDDGKLKSAKEFQTVYGVGSPGKAKWTKAANWVERRLAQDTGSGWYGNVLYPIHHESAKAFTSAEFNKHYEDAYGELYWVQKWKASMEEERQAPDGDFYTFQEYVAHYGAASAWKEWDDHGHHIGHAPRTNTNYAHMSPSDIIYSDEEDEEAEQLEAQLAQEDAEDYEDL